MAVYCLTKKKKCPVIMSLKESKEGFCQCWRGREGQPVYVEGTRTEKGWEPTVGSLVWNWKAVCTQEFADQCNLELFKNRAIAVLCNTMYLQ